MENVISIISTATVAVLLLGLIVPAIVKVWKDMRSGKHGCGGNCAACATGCSENKSAPSANGSEKGTTANREAEAMPMACGNAGGKSKKSEAWSLFTTFLKIGSFTFGGGYAMIPLIQKEVTTKRKWISDEELLDIIAIAESTPGPIAINSATFIGYRTAGLFGAFCATAGVVLPSFFIIIGVSLALQRFREFKPVQYAFDGIRAGVLALIVKALINMYRKCPKTRLAYGIAAFAFAAVAVLRAKVLPVLIVCGVLGYLGTLLMSKGGSR